MSLIKELISKLPSKSDVVELLELTIVAPGIGAPDSSVTVPVTVCCEKAKTQLKRVTIVKI
jgi:hypothetical protein